MADNVVSFTGVSYSEVPIDQVLDGVKSEQLKTVLVIGLTHDDEIVTFFSTPCIPTANWMLDIAKAEILSAE